MVEVNETLTRRTADLARLELTDTEVTTFTKQLGDIIKYVEQLQKLDVCNVEPLTHPTQLAQVLREDLLKPFPMNADGSPKILNSAPDVLYDGYKVPPIL